MDHYLQPLSKIVGLNEVTGERNISRSIRGHSVCHMALPDLSRSLIAGTQKLVSTLERLIGAVLVYTGPGQCFRLDLPTL